MKNLLIRRGIITITLIIDFLSIIIWYFIGGEYFICGKADILYLIFFLSSALIFQMIFIVIDSLLYLCKNTKIEELEKDEESTEKNTNRMRGHFYGKR